MRKQYGNGNAHRRVLEKTRETSMHRCLLYVQTVTFTHPEKSPVASRQRPVRSRARASLDVARFGTSNHLCERTTTDEL